VITILLISSFSILADTPDSLILRYSAEYKKFIRDGKIFYELERGKYPEKEGLPALPSCRKRLLIPIGAKIDLKYQVLQSKKDRGIPSVVYFYNKKKARVLPERYTPPPVEIKKNRPSPFGNATLIVNPFSFDGRTISIRKSILIKLYFRGGKWVNPRGYPARNSSLFLNKIKEKKVKAEFRVKPKEGLYLKLKTIEEGLYEITPGDLRASGLNPSSIDPEKIEVRTGYTKVLKWDMDSLSNLDPLPSLIPAIYETDGDGTFNQGERILFFAHSLSGWDRNRFNEKKFFYYNPYTDTNVYWLRLNGNPRSILEENVNGGEVVSHFTDTIHLEEDNYSPLRSGLAWGWEELNTSGGASQSSWLDIPFTTYNPNDNQAILRIAFYPKNSKVYYFRLSLNGTVQYDTVSSQGSAASERTIFIDTIPALTSGSNQFQITLLNMDESVIMDFVEVIYERKLITEGGKLTIHSDTGSVKHYSVSNLHEEPYLLDISNSEEPYLISHSFNNGSIDFSTTAKEISLQISPYSIRGISISDPTSLWSGGADWVVISPTEFIPSAYKLKAWREKHLRSFSSPIAKVITLKEIYDNFSYGVSDPPAIKRFLNFTQSGWNPPVSYVFLLGDGSYDPKNLTRIGKSCFIPIHTEETYIYTGSGYLDKNPNWDSWFVDFNEDGIQDIPIGRITASNEADADAWIDKLIQYESNSGDWRMNAILLADDAYSPNYSSGEVTHTQGAESISEILPGWLYQKKVYLLGYSRVGAEKPGAEDAFLNDFSEGALVGIFLGHGNLRRLTHESVFLLQDVNKFMNWRKTPIYYFGSCDVGYFERPDEDCIGGYSTLYSEGGNVVSIAAGRATYPGSNNALGRSFVRQLFRNSVTTAGDAFLFAKEEAGHFTYTFFGDPATSILKDSASLIASIPDTARGGESIIIKGKTHTSSNKIYCILAEADYDTTLDADESSDSLPVAIKKIGRRLFKGSAPVQNDSFRIQINLPLDIGGDSGNIYLYSRGDKESHLRLPFYFKKGTGSNDTLPPDISFQVKGRLLSKGNLIPQSGKLTVIVRDSSGIDLRSNPNLQVLINNASPIYLTDKFTYHTGSPTTGEATLSYESPLFSDTIHFKVYAKDNAGNIGLKEATFKIGEEKALWGVDNYPNPMKDRTTIIYHLSKEVRVEIKIFTIAGRLVKELEPGISRYGVNYAEWNGRDEKGRKVSNGIYYYMIKAGDLDNSYGKIAVIR